MKAIAGGKTATLYCKPTVFDAIVRWYWTPGRAQLASFKPISIDQAAKVKLDFKIDVDGWANSLDCPRCGHVYSTYEFIQQGIEEHGEEHVRAAFSLKRTSILQINPVQNVVCRNCRVTILLDGSGRPGSYDYLYRIDKDEWYACCKIIYMAAGASHVQLSPE